MKKTKEKRGITLIALIITIIVLLILAGVSISLTVGDNGVLKNAMVASEKTEIESEREIIQTEYVSKKMENIDKDNIEGEVIGKELSNSGGINDGEKYHVIRVKDEDGNTIEYGTGYEYIEKGTIVNGKEIKNPWILNTKTGETIEIKEENKTEVNGSAGVAVVGEDLRLNLDAMSLSSDNWSNGVINHGEVTFDDENKALIFDGKDDYIELQKAGDFSKGFTFEMYMNLSRILYSHTKNGLMYSGLFCKMPDLSENILLSMRFGYTHDKAICKFNNVSSYVGSDCCLCVDGGGAVKLVNENPGYSENKDTYLTFVYKVYDEEKVDDDGEWNNKSNELEDNKKLDKIEYYINGELYGYTYYGHDSYESGCNTWNKDTCPLFIGVCPWAEVGSNYYLKGKVYATRLYTRDLTKEEVKANFDAAQKSRENLNQKEILE